MTFVKINWFLPVFVVAVAAATQSEAATITWISQGVVTGPGDISLTGTLAGAVNVGADNTARTINGVTFVADGTGPGGTVTTGGISFAMPYLNTVNANFWTLANPGGSAAYNAALDDARFNPVSGTDVTMTLSGLSSGQVYEVQLWYVDTRSGLGARTSTWTAGNAISLDADGTPGPQWVIGQFTADATSQTIVNGPQSGNGLDQLNMIQLRAVPEPGASRS